VHISISLSQYGGAKRKVANFITKVFYLATNQNFSEQEWDLLFKDCLKKEALNTFSIIDLLTTKRSGTVPHSSKGVVRLSSNNCTSQTLDVL
jgi:hypothetical protein